MKKLLFSLCLCSPFIAMAQQNYIEVRPHHEIGLQAGVANYYGDLQRKFLPDYGYRAMGGVMYKYFFTPRFGLRLGAMYTKVTAADSLSGIYAQERRNLRFGSNIFEMHAGFEFNFLGVDIDRAKVSPYIFAGVGAFYANPYTDGQNNKMVFLKTLGTEGQEVPRYADRKQYKLINASFPIGGGLKFFIGKTFMITTEIGLRYTSYDYLDDVSKSYVNMDTLNKYRGKTAVDYSFRGDELENFDGNYPKYGDQRGDSRDNDWFWTGSLGISVYFDALGNRNSYRKANCPGGRPPKKGTF